MSQLVMANMVVLSSPNAFAGDRLTMIIARTPLLAFARKQRGTKQSKRSQRFFAEFILSVVEGLRMTYDSRQKHCGNDTLERCPQ
ncbi:MAG: hypothetical protein AUJ72_00450 [Candidatus Omnitrophica bacterium CG1_02_46_14]|nr:MAG: hypothetical protein AUJ72_00450 [Candidatus Omnitrophica bacterium CG1_02_46_14]